MSRLTNSLFNKPPPFEFPRAPLSPPETHSDAFGTGGVPHVLSAPNLGIQDFHPPDIPVVSGSPDTVGPRPKRTSSIAYNTTSVRETRERPAVRINKALIIVVPPKALFEDPGQHSHAPSTGPYHRLSQGVVMPLVPSLFGQLTSIAREFNFPSTTGLVLYFHYVVEGITITPRISEESWQSLWSHLSDPSHERQPIISGKMEFDIDLRLARWYTSWQTLVRREAVEYASQYHASAAPSLGHFRGESRTTIADSRALFEDDASERFAQNPSPPTRSRHVPRKLSLVERFDPSATRTVAEPAEPMAGVAQVLTTILQEDEPKTARNDLASRVRTWRASSVATPTPLAASGQPSLDPVNLPNNMEIPSSPVLEEEEELRMEDYGWSVSSPGPSSPGEFSPVSWRAVPSVHLAERMAGSVCSTASYHTESGPSDYDPNSPLSWSYPPSVHLAHRLQGSVCSTPSVRTSFGPSDYDPYSPVMASVYLPTPDIAQRFFEDAPATPQTATTWGAPMSFPPSPQCYSPTLSVDIGERAMYDTEEAPRHHYPRELESAPEGQPWAYVWPYTSRQEASSSASQPWAHVWPYNKRGETPSTSQPWNHVWPYNKTGETASSTSQPWGHVWPYNRNSGPETPAGRPWTYVWPYTVRHASSQSTETSTLGYPYLTIYAPAYPHFDLYPRVPGSLEKDISVDLERHRGFNLSVKAPTSYPNFDLYSPVYPYNLDVIYPPTSQPRDYAKSQEGYPYLNIYPSTDGPANIYLSLYMNNPRSQYPTFEIYLGHANKMVNETSISASSSFSAHLHVYPVFNIYPAVYPHFDIYPAVMPRVNDSASALGSLWKIHRVSGYPMFDLYAPVYPHFDIYPAVTPEVKGNTSAVSPLWKIPRMTGYPVFDLYASVYPHFDIYPTVKAKTVVKTEAKTLASTHGLSWKIAPVTAYPVFDLYPAVYPYFDLYPAVRLEAKANCGSLVSHARKESSSCYPTFNLYPAVYPYFDLYPAPYFSIVEKRTTSRAPKAVLSLAVAVLPAYPSFNLYPSLYPFLNIYPTPYFSDSRMSSQGKLTASVSAEVRYPVFNLYPAVYPHFDIYPAVLSHILPPTLRAPPAPRPSTKSRSRSRLTHAELHAMVVMEKMPRKSSLRSPVTSPSGESSPGLRRQTSLVSKMGTYMQSIEQSSSSPSRRSLARQSSTGALGRPAPRKRDSLVLQRVRALDSHPEVPNAPLPLVSRETLAKFPMPPNAFPPLPPIPVERGR